MFWLLFWLIFGLIIALLSAGALAYACYNLVKKIEVYEEWVSYFRSEIETVNTRLKEVDDKQLFVPDDDVGFVFSEIVRIIKEFNDKVK
jgi:hypothetical protein